MSRPGSGQIGGAGLGPGLGPGPGPEEPKMIIRDLFNGIGILLSRCSDLL